MSKDIYKVYKITNSVNEKVYIGITDNLERRWHKHTHDAREKTKRPLYYAMAKYGIDKFTITHICSTKTREDSGIIEQHLIKEQNTMVPNGYNLTSGGEMSYTISEETKKKMSKVRMGIKLSDETKKKMSDYHKGRPKEHLKGRIPWNKGKTHSPETKEKLRQLAIKQHQNRHK